jgi:hypothetical protein
VDNRRQGVVAVTGALAEFDTKFTQAWTTLGAALREAPAGHTSAELVLLGRELSRLSVSTARTAKVNMEVLAANPSVGGAKELAAEAVEACQQVSQRTRIAEQAMEAFTTAEEAAVLMENGQVVAREQQRLMELAAASGNDPQKWQPLVSRLRVALTQTKSIEDLLTPVTERAGSQLRERAKQTIASFSKRRVRLEQALAGGDPSAKLLLDPTMEMTRALREYSRLFSDWHRELGYKPVEMVQAVLRDVGPSYENVSRLPAELETVRRNKNLSSEVQTALLDGRWVARGEALKGHGDLEELRTTADNLFVSDLRVATVAVEALHAAAPGMEPIKMEGKFTEMDRSLRILETGHNLQEAFDGFNFLATNERWDIRSLAARTQSPRDWRWLEARLRGIPEEMNKSKELLQKLANSERSIPDFRFMSWENNPTPANSKNITVALTWSLKTRFVDVGQMVPDTTFRVVSFTKKEAPGADGVTKDVSEITVRDEQTGLMTVYTSGVRANSLTAVQLQKDFEQAQQILWKAQQLPAWRTLNDEMQNRGNIDRVPVTAKADSEQLAGQVKLALDLLRKHMDEARKRLAKIAPSISELAAALAKEQDEIKKDTDAQAEKVEKQKPEEAKAEAQQQLADQKKLDQKVETLKDLIRAEANKQNILDKEQREAMRDADDALALLKDPPPRAEQALQDATNDAQTQQKADLERATEQQKKLEDALNQIAKHFDAVENGKPLAETRATLREAEKELGVKEELDQQLAHAQMLAEMAQKDAASLLKELEAKLPDNPIMQKELSDITKDALANAEQKLNQATQQEKNIAEQLNQQAQQAQKQAAQTAAEAAKEAAEAAKMAQKAAENAEQQAKDAGNPEAQKQADAAGNKAAEAAQAANDAAKAAEQMAKAGNNQEAAQAAEKTAQKAGEAAKAAQQAAQAAKGAQADAQQSAQQGGEHKGQNEQAAQQSGEAQQQAEKAAQAAMKAQALAQQAANQAKAMAQNAKPNPAQPNAAQQAAQTAQQAAQKAAEAAKAAQAAAENAEQQANAAANPQAAQQADMAGNDAAKAAQAAQAAADQAEMAAESGNAQKAQAAAQQAAQKAGEAAKAAEKAANAAQQAQNSSNQAAQQGGEHKGQNEQAAQQAGQAQQQAQAAAKAAKEAQALAQQAAQQAGAMAQQNQQLANAAAQQQPIAQNTAEAAADVQRAGRHEMRLGNPAGEPLQKLGNEIAETAQSDVPAAQQALAQAQMAAQAQAPVNQAAGELAQELAALQNAQQGGQPAQAGQPPAGQQAAAQPAGQPPAGQPAGAPPAGQAPAGDPAQAGQAAEAAPASPAEQAAMARALDALDQQLNGQPAAPAQAGQPGQPPGQPGQPGQEPGQPGNEAGQPGPAQAALAQAAQAAAAAMRQSRAQQSMAQTPGSLVSQTQQEKSEAGAQVSGEGLAYKLDTTAQGLKRGDWGRLPKKLADQLTKGQQEAIAGDYRQAVETYYKVIAERAKKQ